MSALAAATQEHLAKPGAQPSTEWYAPPEVAFQLEADMAPGRGQDSAERAVQQLRQKREVMLPTLLRPVRPSGQSLVQDVRAPLTMCCDLHLPR